MCWLVKGLKRLKSGSFGEIGLFLYLEGLCVHIGSPDGPHPFISSGGRFQLFWAFGDAILGRTHKKWMISSITTENHPRASIYTIYKICNILRIIYRFQWK